MRPQKGRPSAMLRQETLLRATAVRIRRYLGLSENSRIKTPLLVIVPKFDVWTEEAGVSLDEEPFQGTGQQNFYGMDLKQVERNSKIFYDIFKERVKQ